MDWNSMMYAFRKPFPITVIKKRKEVYTDKKTGEKREMTFDYVDAAHVIDRLNDTMQPWEFRVLQIDERSDPNQIVTLGELSVWHPDLGMWIRKQQCGSALQQGGSEPYGNARKSSATDALKKCAQQFGIANHLWGGELEWEPSEPLPPQMTEAQPVTMPVVGDPPPQALTGTQTRTDGTGTLVIATDDQRKKLQRAAVSSKLPEPFRQQVKNALAWDGLKKSHAADLLFEATRLASAPPTTPAVTIPDGEAFVIPSDADAPPPEKPWATGTAEGIAALQKIQERKKTLLKFAGQEDGTNAYDKLLEALGLFGSNDALMTPEKAAVMVAELDKLITAYTGAAA